LYCRFTGECAHIQDTDGWIIKAPFTTNSKGTSRSTLDNLTARILKVNEKYSQQLQYVFLQPKLIFNIEYKVVLIEERAEFLFVTKGRGRDGAPSPDMKNLYLFAESALQELKKVCPAAILDGLIRVDIFVVNGNFVVNEFESIEAGWRPKSGTKERDATTKLMAYWKKKLLSTSQL
jgi:hypothetical protein